MTKILLVIRYPIGGIRNYLRYTYAKLDPRSYEVTVLTVDREEGRLLAKGLSPIPLTLEEVPEARARTSLLRRTRELLRERRFDLIHSQGFTAGVLAFLGNTSRGLPHVLTLHETLRREQFLPPLGGIRRLFLSLVLSRIDRVILVSEDALVNLQEFLPRLAHSRGKLQVIRNGVDVEALLRDSASAQGRFHERLSPDRDVVLFGYVGRFMPEKGFDVLIDAVEKLVISGGTTRSFKIVAVNDGAFVREYQEIIQRRHLEAYFAFPGFQPSVAGLISELDAVIMPSLREALPLVALETFVLGCPLIASDCVGLREVTRGSPALVSAAGEPSSLAGTMSRFLEAPAGFKAEATRFASQARATFDSAVTAKRLEQVFREVLAER